MQKVLGKINASAQTGKCVAIFWVNADVPYAKAPQNIRVQGLWLQSAAFALGALWVLQAVPLQKMSAANTCALAARKAFSNQLWPMHWQGRILFYPSTTKAHAVMMCTPIPSISIQHPVGASLVRSCNSQSSDTCCDESLAQAHKPGNSAGHSCVKISRGPQL